MEARSSGIDSRYGYQGLYAEKDKVTGWNSFELRNYDPAVKSVKFFQDETR